MAISVKMKIRMNQILISLKLNLDRNENLPIYITWCIHNLIPQSLVYKLKTNITFFNITAICKSSTKRKILKLNSKPFRNLTNASKKKKGRINITRVKMNVL